MYDENLDRAGKDLHRLAEIDSLRSKLGQAEAALRAAQQEAKTAWKAAKACDNEIARLREFEQDSVRYRWVRDHCTAEENPEHTWIVEAPGSEWDEAIDNAMKEDQK